MPIWRGDGRAEQSLGAYSEIANLILELTMSVVWCKVALHVRVICLYV